MGEEEGMIRLFFIMGSCSAFLAVALGAFGAHMLKDKLTPELLAVFEVGVRYQMYHALGLFVVAWALSQFPASGAGAAGWLFLAGTVVFSGSLYALSLTGMRWLGAVTPLGGLCFLAGWAWLAWGVWRASPPIP
jgi:uncharacterized membrane protein YgdD (TMEM256/DUF423 family)